MMVTPRVVKEARAHFNCSKLEGAELENQGESGTHTTHWEKRLYEVCVVLFYERTRQCLQNEAMTGTHTQNPVYSRLTLAMMEDTGWYTANYSMAQPLHWGHNLGCNFAMGSCAHWIAMRKQQCVTCVENSLMSSTRTGVYLLLPTVIASKMKPMV